MLNRVLSLFFSIVVFCSCEEQHNKIESCKQEFKKARDLAYKNPDDTASLNSALNITNGLLSCDSLRIAIVEFRIALFASLKRYNDGISFVKTLNKEDFNFDYKRDLLLKNFEALNFGYNNDSLHRDSIYLAMVMELEKYIDQNKLSNTEFEEVFIYLYTIKSHIVTKDKIRSEIDSLKSQYPQKASFFDFLYR